jgi:lipopolysaccharide biosynthesis glycosyltransferase
MYASDFLFFSIMLLLLVLMGFITIYDHMSDHNWEKSHHRTLRNRLEDATKTVDVVKVKNNPCCMARTKVCMACEMGITIANFCENIAPLHKEDFGCDETKHATTLSHTSKNAFDEPEMIITSVYNYKKDPQRRMKVDCNFDYIANFYNSIVFYKLNAVIMHDCFSKKFIDRFSTSNIKFVKVNANKDMSTNDFRFVQYNKYIEQHVSPYYMFVDASDVFFNGNPFNYMKRNEHGHTLFMSPDIGKFHKNAWQVKKCYNRAGELWDQNVKMHNAGVWGGDCHTTKCILECVVNQLTTTLKGRGNCNMPALNWCVHFGDCTDENTVEDQPDFVNPFLKECRGDHLIIHNKCKDTEGKTCLVEKEGKLVLVEKEKGCTVSGSGMTKETNKWQGSRFDLFNTISGDAVEIGTFNGDFAEHNIIRNKFPGNYYMVDITIKKELQERLDKWKDKSNVHFLHMTSIEASKQFKDDSLSLVYIDALHSYDAVYADMKAWYSKLKPGGTFAGHDYCVSKKEKASQYPDMPWCGIYSSTPKEIALNRVGKEKISQLPSSLAVKKFAKEHGLIIHHTIESSDKWTNPSWYTIKPGSEPGLVHVVYAVDQNIMGVKESILSLIDNTETPSTLRVHLFHMDGFVPNDLPSSVELHTFSVSDVNAYINRRFSASDRGNLMSPANYVRFTLFKKFGLLKKVWWLDSDTLIKGDIVKLTKETNKGMVDDKHLLAAFPRNFNPLSKSVYEALGKNYVNKGFNAGILYLNLGLWRKNNINREILSIIDINNNKGLWKNFGSQPPLTIVTGNNFYALPVKYYLDGLGYKKGITVPSSAFFLHWNGKHKPWLEDGFYKDIWKGKNVQRINILSSIGWHKWCEKTLKPLVSSGERYHLWSDKHSVKKMLSTTVPNLRVAREYAAVDKAEDITTELLASLPENYFMKATHTSGGLVMIKNNKIKCLKAPCKKQKKGETKIEYLRRLCNLFFHTNYGMDKGELWYGKIAKKCIFEEAFPEAAKASFKDFKVWIMNNVTMMVQIDASRHTGSHTRIFVTPSYKLINIKEPNNYYHPSHKLEQKPVFWDELLRYASKISEKIQLPSVRIDFFVFQETYAFSEVTFAHDSCKRGVKGFIPNGAEKFYGYVVTHPDENINPEDINKYIQP